MMCKISQSETDKLLIDLQFPFLIFILKSTEKECKDDVTGRKMKAVFLQQFFKIAS